MEKSEGDKVVGTLSGSGFPFQTAVAATIRSMKAFNVEEEVAWAAPDGAPLKMRHATCGRLVKAVAACSHCGEPLSPRSVIYEPGPGAVDGDHERTALEGISR